MFNFEFLIREEIAHVPHSRDASPRLRDALTRAKPRQEYGAGPEAGRGRDAGGCTKVRMLETPTQSGQGVNVVLEQTWRPLRTWREQRVKSESFCGKWGEGFGGRALFQ